MWVAAGEKFSLHEDLEPKRQVPILTRFPSAPKHNLTVAHCDTSSTQLINYGV